MQLGLGVVGIQPVMVMWAAYFVVAVGYLLWAIGVRLNGGEFREKSRKSTQVQAFEDSSESSSAANAEATQTSVSESRQDSGSEARSPSPVISLKVGNYTYKV
eukprot:1330755-Amorphochlora_amoeboformis.AAC.1